MKTTPGTITVRLAAQFEDLTETDAGWTYSMWAQFYSMINDRAFWFFPGSFAKTIKERVSRNAVKISDGHPFEPDAANTLGRVVTAEETPRGCRYTGFLTRSSEEAAEKINNGTINENSVHVRIVKADRIERPLEDVPDSARPWVEITENGLAVITGITEVMWWAVGLVPASSQDKDAVISVPSAVSFDDLPVSLSPWNPAGARERLEAWAGAVVSVPSQGVSGLPPDIVRLGRGHVAQMPGGGCFGQIVDIEEGRPVVVADALSGILASLEGEISEKLGDREIRATVDSAALLVSRYQEKAENLRRSKLTPPTADATDNGETAQTGGAEPPTGTHSDEGSDEERLSKLLRTVKLQQLRQRAQGVKDEPAGNGRGFTAGG